MKSKVTEQQSQFDGIKWGLIVLLLLGGIVGNDYFHAILAVKLLAWLVLLAIVVVVALQTTKGKAAFAFLQESRTEMRKVVWPNRPETLRTTFIVLAMCIVIALLLWGVDGILVWALGWLSG